MSQWTAAILFIKRLIPFNASIELDKYTLPPAYATPSANVLFPVVTADDSDIIIAAPNDPWIPMNLQSLILTSLR
jgi:hypothetical protein